MLLMKLLKWFQKGMYFEVSVSMSLCSDVRRGRITDDGHSRGFRAQKTWIQTLSLLSLFLMRIIKESHRAVRRIN